MRDAFAGAIMAFLGLSGAVLADDPATYPDKPLMLVVSAGAGGATDYQARIVTQTAMAPERLGMPIAILNKPGENGRAGWTWFANHAPADGYTLAAYNVPHFIAQSLQGDADYGVESFEPIANWGADPAVLVVAAESDFAALDDVLRFARENPGALTVSGSAAYSGHHIAALQLEKAAGVTLDFTPKSDGGAAALKSVIRGEVMAGINNLSDAYRAKEEGEVRVLGLFDLSRHAYLPDVPTMLEQGYQISDASVNYRGIMVPKGTPQAIIDRLAEDLQAMFGESVVRKKMKEAGAPMRIMPRAQVQQMWQNRARTLRNLFDEL